MTKQYDKEFKENAVQYRYDHPELTVKECAKNMVVPYDTYHGWLLTKTRPCIFRCKVLFFYEPGNA